MIVFDDADIDNAVASVLAANFFSQGEVCSNGRSRGIMPL